MRIGLLAPELTEAHGWGRYTIDLARALAGQEDVTLVIAASAASPGDGGLPHEGYSPILPPVSPAQRGVAPRSLLAVPRLRRLFASCDVLHATAEHYLPAAALAAGSRPVIVTAHGTYLPLHLRGRLGALFRRAAARATILAVSRYTAEQVRLCLPGAALQVISNGVHVERFSRPPAALPEKAGPTVLSVGVNKARKGFHILLEALPLVRADVPDVQCVIIGDNRDQPYQAYLRGIIAARGLEGAAHLLGRVPEETLLGWYHRADVFALPSLNTGGQFEGFGLVHLEAGAAGLPTIGTLGCGAEDAIEDGRTGFLIPQDDPAALAAAITRLLRDPDLRARQGRAGRARAEAFSWEAIAAQVRRVYDGVAARP